MLFLHKRRNTDATWQLMELDVKDHPIVQGRHWMLEKVPEIKSELCSY